MRLLKQRKGEIDSALSISSKEQSDMTDDDINYYIDTLLENDNSPEELRAVFNPTLTTVLSIDVSTLAAIG